MSGRMSRSSKRAGSSRNRTNTADGERNASNAGGRSRSPITKTAMADGLDQNLPGNWTNQKLKEELAVLGITYPRKSLVKLYEQLSAKSAGCIDQ